MPTFMELQQRQRQPERVSRVGNEEVLVIDGRSKMRPGEIVDLKLRAAHARQRFGRQDSDTDFDSE